MSKSIKNEEDIGAMIPEIKAIGAKLEKLSKDGKITVEDVQVASLTAALPESFTSVTSPFEQRNHVDFEDLCKACGIK